MKKYIVYSLTLFIFTILTLQGQKGVEDGSKYGKKEDSVRCVKYLSLYREYVKQNNYQYAIGPWRVVFNECPRSSKNIYIDGAKMYNHFIVKEKDPDKRQKLIDTLMMVYDQRIRYFKEKGNVLGRKGVDLLRYKRDDIQALEEGYNYLDESIKLRKEKSSVAVIATYMMSTFALFQAAKLDTAQVIKNFVASDDILDAHIAKKDNDQTTEVKETIFNNFVASGAGTCKSLIAYYEPLFEEKKGDITYLKNVSNLLEAIQCEDEELFVKTAEIRFPLEPSAEAAKTLAKVFEKKSKYSKASVYYNKAVELETDSLKIADYYNQLARIHCIELQQYSAARSYAYKAINYNRQLGQPYLYIGLAYALSSKNCGDEFTQKTVYWAAVDKFYQAKAIDPSVSEDANKLISSYSCQFPNKEELFFHGIEEGSTQTIGCWINETTKARAR